LKDCEIKFKLKEIDDKMRLIGGELDVKMLEDFNPKAALEDSDSGFGDSASAQSKQSAHRTVNKAPIRRTNTNKSARSRRSKSSRRSLTS